MRQVNVFEHIDCYHMIFYGYTFCTKRVKPGFQRQCLARATSNSENTLTATKQMQPSLRFPNIGCAYLRNCSSLLCLPFGISKQINRAHLFAALVSLVKISSGSAGQENTFILFRHPQSNQLIACSCACT